MTRVSFLDAGRRFMGWSWRTWVDENASNGTITVSLLTLVAHRLERQQMLLAEIVTLLGQIQKNTKKKRRRAKKAVKS